MRPRLLALASAAAVLLAALPAAAAPVFVELRTAYGPLEPGVPVVAFSYDVERVYPDVERRFAQWKPQIPLPNTYFKPIPNLRPFATYFLLHASQLENYREDFQKAHRDDPAMLRDLMPRFDAVYKKYGERASDISTNILQPEDERQLWCQKVTRDLNLVIDEYNARNGAGDAAMETYRQNYARWLGKRNEALRFAVVRAGGNPNLNFVESVTTSGGVAGFDLPAGTWYVAAQTDLWSWYRPMRVTTYGGRVQLTGQDASRRRLTLADWVGN